MLYKRKKNCIGEITIKKYFNIKKKNEIKYKTNQKKKKKAVKNFREILI